MTTSPGVNEPHPDLNRRNDMPYEYRTQRRIEFSDTDMAGIVHFARFFIFVEIAEHEFIRSLVDTVFPVFDGRRIGWPRLAASCEYSHPAKFEDLLEVHLLVSRKGNKSLTYQFEFKKEDVRIAYGQESVVCCLHEAGKGFKAISIPAPLADRIQQAPEELLFRR